MQLTCGFLPATFMAIRRIAPETSAAFAGSLIYVLLSIYSGSILRNSSDDEIGTLLIIQDNSFVELLQFPFLVDDHPPLAYLVFKGLWTVWPSLYLLRCFSLICSTVCIFLGIRLVLDSLRSRTQTGEPWNIGAAVLIIATTPLIVAQGDSIRGYSMFAALVFGAFSYEGRNKRWHSAVLTGIGFSTEFSGIAIYAGIVGYRLWAHGKDRTASARVIADEAGYGLCFAATGFLGLTNLVSRLVAQPDAIANQLTSPLAAIGQASLGLVGGYSLGVRFGLPLVAAYGVLFIHAAWRQRDAVAKIMFVLVPSLVPALIVLAGFARSRAFLFLAVTCSMVLAVSVLRAPARRASAIAGAVIVIHMLAVANRGGTAGLFKRNLAIPFAEISEFIAGNLPVDGALITTDAVVAYTARERGLSCVASTIVAPCLREKHGSVVTVTGESGLRTEEQILEFARSRCPREEATVPFGIDEEAVLKSRLTGVPLSIAILRGRLFKGCD